MVLLIFALGNLKIGAMKPIFLDSGSPREEGGLCVRGHGFLSLYSSYIYKIQGKKPISLSLTAICAAAELCFQTT